MAGATGERSRTAEVVLRAMAAHPDDYFEWDMALNAEVAPTAKNRK